MTTRLVEAVLAVLNAAGADWRLDRRLSGGLQTGAWLVHDADRAAVLKVTGDAAWSTQVVRAAAAVERAVEAGYPTPRWLASGITPDGIGWQLQEQVVGRTVDHLDLTRARAVLEMVELQQDLDPDPGRNWADFLLTQLTVGASRLWTGAEAAGAPRELLDCCRRLAAGAAELDWTRVDLVHGDLRPGNILFDGDLVAGVVDLEAIGSGPRVFDLATLLSHHDIAADAVDLVVHAASSIDRAQFRACLAQVFLDQIVFLADRPELAVGDLRPLTTRALEVERRTR